MIASVDEAAAVLYREPLDGFVAARDALVKEVRTGGDRSLANGIKALRKPTVAADALNRAIRQDPEAVEVLLAAVERLRETQEALLSGGVDAGEPADFATDQRAYRDAVEAVVGNVASNEVEVRAAIEAAATGGLVAELRAAAFATLPGPTGGFGPFAAGPGRVGPRGGGTAGDGAASDTARGGAESDRTGPRRPSAAERRLADRVRRAAEQAVTTAEDELAAAEDAVATTAGRLSELDAELAELERRLGDARSARDDAVAARAAAEASRATIAGLLEEARATLDGLGDPGHDQESG